MNGAGYQPGITPGAWLSIFGDNLASISRPWNPQTEITSGKLPTSLDGVSVTINGKAAPIYYISPNQINIQAPSDDTTGPVQVVVTNANGTSNAVTAAIQTILARVLPDIRLLRRRCSTGRKPRRSRFASETGRDDHTIRNGFRTN